MCKNIPKVNLPEHFLLDDTNEHSIFFEPVVTRNELVLIIQKLKTNSSPGPDKNKL